MKRITWRAHVVWTCRESWAIARLWVGHQWLRLRFFLFRIAASVLMGSPWSDVDDDGDERYDRGCNGRPR